MRRLLVLATLLIALLATGASSALAASISRSGDAIVVTGTDDSERIRVSFDAGESNYVFEDLDPSDVGFTAPCEEDDDNNQNAQCAAAGTNRFVFNMGGGSDGTTFAMPDINMRPATIDGGAGDDCGFVNLDGASRNDVIDGGEGDDCIGSFPGDDQVTGGPGDDEIFGGSDVDTLRGGDGNDRLFGGADDDDIFGGGDGDTISGGTGADEAFGEAGNDSFDAGPQADVDVMDGDEGIDSVQYDNRMSGEPVSVTLDNQANDGAPGEGDNALDMEDVLGGTDNDTLRGSDNSEFSVMAGGPGNDNINPGTLEDVVAGNDGDDTIEVRDGFADRVACGPGTDTLFADAFDILAPDCENVTLEQRAPARDVPEDRPPTVAFTGPAAGASLAARTTLTADATDDRGVARVLFLDEDRIVCTDTAAPYTCDYQPRGEDVGRNTLVAVAVDTSEQTAAATRTVSVPRFLPTLSIAVTPRADRRVPFRFTTSGRITLPTGVSAALGCRGTVTIQIKSGANTISTRRARVGPDCRYRSAVSFGVTRRLVSNRLTVRATFGGNDVLLRRVSRRVSVAVRR